MREQWVKVQFFNTFCFPHFINNVMTNKFEPHFHSEMCLFLQIFSIPLNCGEILSNKVNKHIMYGRTRSTVLHRSQMTAGVRLATVQLKEELEAGGGEQIMLVTLPC